VDVVHLARHPADIGGCVDASLAVAVEGMHHGRAGQRWRSKLEKQWLRYLHKLTSVIALLHWRATTNTVYICLFPSTSGGHSLCRALLLFWRIPHAPQVGVAAGVATVRISGADSREVGISAVNLVMRPHLRERRS
jgi:hypothetical protein